MHGHPDAERRWGHPGSTRVLSGQCSGIRQVPLSKNEVSIVILSGVEGYL